MRPLVFALVLGASTTAIAADGGAKGPKPPSVAETVSAGTSAVEKAKGCKGAADGLDVGALAALAVSGALGFAAGVVRGRKK